MYTCHPISLAQKNGAFPGTFAATSLVDDLSAVRQMLRNARQKQSLFTLPQILRFSNAGGRLSRVFVCFAWMHAKAWELCGPSAFGIAQLNLRLIG